MKYCNVLFIIFYSAYSLIGQQNYMEVDDNTGLVYAGGKTHEVECFASERVPDNVILLIGDGMGVTQVFAAITANQGKLFLENFKTIGFSKTQSGNKYITDSAAGGTALSSGVKTYNGAIGVDMDTVPVRTILEDAEAQGLSTGLVSVSSITHATPASFIAHQESRGMLEAIAADFLKTDIDVFIGGGYDNFANREDGRDLTRELADKDYAIARSLEELNMVQSGKLAALTAPGHNGRVAERGDYLPLATSKAIELLKEDEDGFFLMVEGSAIDWAGHQRNITYMVEEMLDFDKAIGEALKFAAEDGNTLVVVTADHETGGVAVTGGDMAEGTVEAGFPTKGHTAVMVPVFAYGPGAELFGGIYENTDVHHKIHSLLIAK
jgi:alkaline phosphatase